MRRVLALLVVGCCLAGPAWADAGRGGYVQERRGVLAAAGSPPLASISADVIRFSSAPALGGRAWIVELHRTRSGAGAGEVRYFEGHSRLGWKPAGARRLAMSGDAYAQLTAAIDGALDRGEAEPTDPSQIVVCTDGPGYVAERRRRGVNLWQTGSSCGAFHPNDEVAALLEDAVGSRPNDLDGKAACEIAKTRGRHLGQTVVFRGEYLTDHMEKAAIRPIGCDVAFGLGSLADDVERRIQSADPPPWISPQRRMIAVFTGLLTQRGRDGLQFYRDDGIRLDVTSMTDLKVIGAPRP